MNRRQKIRERVMSRVYENWQRTHDGTPCWEWQGPTSGEGRGGGYGRMSIFGQTAAVHIVMFVNEHGYLPSRKQVDHKCENRICCNPDHLEAVTPRENQRRIVKRCHK